MTDEPIHVVIERAARGDVGPCGHDGCLNRATWVTALLVHDVEATVFTCDEHRFAHHPDPHR